MTIANTTTKVALTDAAGNVIFNGYSSDLLFEQMSAAGFLQNPTKSATEPTGGADGDWWLDASGPAAVDPPTAPAVWKRHNGAAFVAAPNLQAMFGNPMQVGALVIQGNWDANTNTPTLADGTGTAGHLYRVSTAGTTNLGGENDWQVGDQIFYTDAGTWAKIDNTESAATPTTTLNVV